MSVTGVGGVFLACPDVVEMRDWYSAHLGLEFAERGDVRFAWKESASDRVGQTVFEPIAAEDTDYFRPGTQPFMVDYRVADLEDLLARLCESGQKVVDRTLETEDGRFGWVVDPDGQKVELWEPAGDLDPPKPADGVAIDSPGGGLITGLGGVFFRSPDVTALKTWYREQLGVMPGEDGYVVFECRELDDTATFTAWEIFPADTTYFDSEGIATDHPLMVNFRVRDLALLLDRLRAEHVWVDPKTEEYEFGNFGWIRDPMGARIELWEPPPGAP